MSFAASPRHSGRKRCSGCPGAKEAEITEPFPCYALAANPGRSVHGSRLDSFQVTGREYPWLTRRNAQIRSARAQSAISRNTAAPTAKATPGEWKWFAGADTPNVRATSADGDRPPGPVGTSRSVPLPVNLRAGDLSSGGVGASLVRRGQPGNWSSASLCPEDR